MDKILISNLRVKGIIGIDPWERDHEQEVLINITAYTDTKQAEVTDDIADCVDYRALSNAVKELVGKAKRLTVESLAGDVADLCLGMDGVLKVKVRIEKPAVLPNVEKVGVEIIRRR